MKRAVQTCWVVAGTVGQCRVIQTPRDALRVIAVSAISKSTTPISAAAGGCPCSRSCAYFAIWRSALVPRCKITRACSTSSMQSKKAASSLISSSRLSSTTPNDATRPACGSIKPRSTPYRCARQRFSLINTSGTRDVPFRRDSRGAGDHFVELLVILPEQPDEELIRSVVDWEAEHPYNPRQGKGAAS